MSRNAYVLLSDGASYHPVTNYLAVAENDVLDFYPGDTYRDLFPIPESSAGPSADKGLWFPNDGLAYSNGVGLANQTYARVSDEVAHKAPRDNRNRQTRLRFFAGVEYEFTVDTAADTLILPAGHELDVGTMITLTSTIALPAGLSAGQLYFVIAASALRVKLSTTNGGSAVNITGAGTGTHTAFARVVIADFKPSEWTSWSNAKPSRF